MTARPHPRSVGGVEDRCRRCRMANRPGAHFCPRCGARTTPLSDEAVDAIASAYGGRPPTDAELRERDRRFRAQVRPPPLRQPVYRKAAARPPKFDEATMRGRKRGVFVLVGISIFAFAFTSHWARRSRTIDMPPVWSTPTPSPSMGPTRGVPDVSWGSPRWESVPETPWASTPDPVRWPSPPPLPTPPVAPHGLRWSTPRGPSVGPVPGRGVPSAPDGTTTYYRSRSINHNADDGDTRDPAIRHE